jgi:transcriptional regulator with XRE-family HTH domain
MARRRREAGISRRALARATGISNRQLLRYERDGVSPPYDKCLVIAGELGCTVEDLFLDDDAA